tara:strand:- start:38 stop:2488 length:2451 start_codon:yes stop_codon:yes gene_type:complete
MGSVSTLKKPSNQLFDGFNKTDYQWIADLAWVSTLFRDSNYKDDFSTDSEFSNAIKWTDYGKYLFATLAGEQSETTDDHVLQLLRNASDVTSYTNSDIALAMIGNAEFNTAWISQETDLEQLLSFFERWLLSGAIRLPFVWSKQFDEKIFEWREEHRRSELIPYDTWWAILEDLPTGVFQVGTWVTGPFGVLCSQQIRNICPHISFPLWQKDQITGEVKLSERVNRDTPKIGINAVYPIIRPVDSLLSNEEPSFAFKSKLQAKITIARLLNNQQAIGELITECFLEEELRCMLRGFWNATALPPELKKEKSDFMAILDGLTDIPKIADFFEDLELNGLMQLVLLLSNHAIRFIVERLVLNEDICIPAAEIRTLRPGLIRDDFAPSAIELGHLGLRERPVMPTLKLRNLIIKAYTDLDITNDLMWRIKAESKEQIENYLASYIRDNGVEHTIETLLLSTLSTASWLQGELNIPELAMEFGSSELQSIAAYKLGFNISDSRDPIEVFMTRHNTFQNILNSSPRVATESTREHIRSHAVNYFESVENILGKLIPFNCWMMKSDHLETQLAYDLASGNKAVSELESCTDHKSSHGTWDINGENALGTLLDYLGLLNKWLSGKKEAHRREESWPGDRDCPFEHTEFWADCDEREYNAYISDLSTFAKHIYSADVCKVRNGILHHRDKGRFPSFDDIFSCLENLKTAVDFANEKALYPISFHKVNSTTCELTGSISTLFRSNNHEHERLVFKPSSADFRSIRKSRHIKHYLFAPRDFLTTADSWIYFSETEPSSYSKFWHGYPKTPEPNHQMAFLKRFGFDL